MADELSPKEKKIEIYIKKRLVNRRVFFDYNSIIPKSYKPKSLTHYSQLYFYDSIVKKMFKEKIQFIIGKDEQNSFFLDTKTMLPLLDFSFSDCYYMHDSYYSCSFVCVQINKKWGVFDLESQKLCIPPVFDVIEFIHDTYEYFIVVQDGKYGLCDKYGYLVVELDFDKISMMKGNILLIEKEGYRVAFSISEESIVKTFEEYEHRYLMSTKTKNQISFIPGVIIKQVTIEEKMQYEKKAYYNVSIGRKAYNMLNKLYIDDGLKLKIKKGRLVLRKNQDDRLSFPFPDFLAFREGDIIYISNDINNLFAIDCYEPEEGGVFVIRKRGDHVTSFPFRFYLLYARRHVCAEVNGEYVNTGEIIVPRTFFEHELYDTIKTFKTGQEIWNFVRGKVLRVCDVIYYMIGSGRKENGTYTSIKMSQTPVFEIMNKDNEDADNIYGLIKGNYRIVSDKNGKYGISLKDKNKKIIRCLFDKIEWDNDLVLFHLSNKVSAINFINIEKFQ